MTSKFKCPFCGEELEDAGIHSAELYFCCTNCYMKQKEKDDNYTASPRIWQALIQAKQDLEFFKEEQNRSATALIERTKELDECQKDLEIARKVLKEIDTTRCIPQQTLVSLGKFSKTTRFNAGNIICVATPDYIHNTLKQIEHKE